MKKQNKIWIGTGVIVGIIFGYDIVKEYIDEHQVSWFKGIIFIGCVLLTISNWNMRRKKNI